MPTETERRRSTNRRRFIKTAGLTGAVGLAGCLGGNGSNGGTKGGTKNGSGGTTTIEYWTLFGGGDGEAMKAMVEEFNSQHKDVQINRQRLPWSEYYTKLYTALTGGKAPDLAVVHATLLAKYKDVLTPLSDHIGSETSSAYVPSIWNMTKIDGKRVSLPLDTHPIGFYYNKSIFESAGLDPEKPPASPQEFKDACNAITEKTDKLAFGPTPYGPLELIRTFQALHTQLGGQILTDDKSAAAFDGKKGVEVANYLANVSGKWNWDKATMGDSRWTKAFRSGDMAIIQNGTWYYGVAKEQDFEFGMFKPYVMPGKTQNATWANSHTLGIPLNPNRSKEKQQAAITAAEWLTKNSTKWATVAGHLPASQQVLESDKLRQTAVWDKTLHTFYEIAQNDNLAYLPRTPNFNSYIEPIYKNLAQVYTHKITPEKGIEQAAQKVNKVLQG
jgi:multiple sugar transport system substrate-binding protein